VVLLVLPGLVWAMPVSNFKELDEFLGDIGV